MTKCKKCNGVLEGLTFYPHEKYCDCRERLKTGGIIDYTINNPSLDPRTPKLLIHEIIKALVDHYPNDQDLGGRVRNLILNDKL